MKLLLRKPDAFGAFASTMCVVHCLISPFLFVAHSTNIHSIGTSPFWWKSLDFVFLVFSFWAIYRSVQTSSKKSMKYILWANWGALFFVIINEKLHWLMLPEFLTYSIGISLALFHLYNLKYCQCTSEDCCVQ